MVMCLQLMVSLLLVLTLGQLSLCSAEEVDRQAAWLDAPVTIEFSNENLSSALEKISNQTGISILYDEALAKEKVSASYYNVKAVEAINRLFAGKNKSLSFNDEKKAIIVKHFGAKGYVWATGQEVESAADAEFGKKMTLADLERLHEQQFIEYKKRLANDDEILEGGMTRGEVKVMHEQQHKEYKHSLLVDDTLLEGGMTLGELKNMHEQQMKEFKKQITNNDEMLESGITRGELKALHEHQLKKFREKLNNDDVVLDGGITRGELRALHEQQYRAYIENYKNKSRAVE